MDTHRTCSLARAAIADGVSAKVLRDIAACGAGGSSRQNECRDYRRLVERIQLKQYGVGLQMEVSVSRHLFATVVLPALVDHLLLPPASLTETSQA